MVDLPEAASESASRHDEQRDAGTPTAETGQPDRASLLANNLDALVVGQASSAEEIDVDVFKTRCSSSQRILAGAEQRAAQLGSLQCDVGGHCRNDNEVSEE